MTLVKLVSALTLVAAVAGTAQADPVVDSFYTRCVSENAYRMQPADLQQACACMTPVLVSFLTPEARAQVEDAIRNEHSVTFSGSPYTGSPGDIARSAIRQCPAVGAAMYQQKCSGTKATAPECQEMKALLDQAP